MDYLDLCFGVSLVLMSTSVLIFSVCYAIAFYKFYQENK